MYFKKQIGKLGEDKACDYLINKGYRIIDRNYHCKYGEIDIIAASKVNELVFVEVKTRRSLKYGTPSEAITYNKIKHIVSSSKVYMYLNKFYNVPVRYDVVEIFLYNYSFSVNHIIDAF